MCAVATIWYDFRFLKRCRYVSGHCYIHEYEYEKSFIMFGQTRETFLALETLVSMSDFLVHTR